jgi:hypothetical protein
MVFVLVRALLLHARAWHIPPIVAALLNSG